MNQDLGRHIKIGEIIVKTFQIPQTNLFSYTNPDFPFINHHWLSEVIFYLLSQINLNSLLYLKVILVLSAFFILIKHSVNRSGIFPTIISILLFSPFFLDRSQIRPEIFGYLFFSFLLFLLLTYPKNKKYLFPIPLIMILWVNIHISFVFGLFIIGLLILKSLILYKKNFLKEKYFLLIVALSIFSVFLNPNGISGALYPFTIFSNYGYTIAENQNLLYLNGMTSNLWIKYFFILSPLVFISSIILLSRTKIIELIILIVFYLTTFIQIRHMPFFVLAVIPVFALSLKYIFEEILKKLSKDNKSILYLSLSGIFIFYTLFFVSGWFPKTFDINRNFGSVMTEDAKKGVEFLNKNKLEKNIFNNFDIGGYLIYSLYPQYKFFVDNRPEAYPADFLKNTYMNIHTDKNLRDKMFEKYNIKTIFFAHSDQTGWAESFIAEIYKDLNWKLIYADSSIIILSRKTQLPDIRNSNQYFRKVIGGENNYIKLFSLIKLYNLFEKFDLSQETFDKIARINPASCSVKKILVKTYQNPLYLYQSQELKNKYWYCF